MRLNLRLSCHSLGFAASAHKPAILSNRNIKTILYNLQVKTRSQRGRDRRLQPLTSLRPFCLAASSRCLAKVRKRSLGLGTQLGSSLCLGHSCNAAGESSASRLKHCRKARRKAKPTPVALGYCVGSPRVGCRSGFLLAPRPYEQVRWRSATASVRADRCAADD